MSWTRAAAKWWPGGRTLLVGVSDTVRGATSFALPPFQPLELDKCSFARHALERLFALLLVLLERRSAASAAGLPPIDWPISRQANSERSMRQLGTRGATNCRRRR